jgi:hypothetical protein
MNNADGENPNKGVPDEGPVSKSPATQAGEHSPLPDPFDPASLRLSAADTAGIGAKRVIVTVTVGKPEKQDFVRAHHDASHQLDTATLVDSVDRQHYLVAPALWGELSREIKPVRLVTALTRHGKLFLWPATLPPPDGRTNQWHESMLAAQNLATKKWVRVMSGKSEYEVLEPTHAIPEPEWPDITFREILRLAFKGRLIDSMDHPVLKALRGEV